MKVSHLLSVLLLLGAMDTNSVVKADVQIEEVEEKDPSVPTPEEDIKKVF